MLNFLYSLPQLLHLIPCPRHRLPAFDAKTGLMQLSMCRFRPSSLSRAGRLCFRLLSALRLVTVRPCGKNDDDDDKDTNDDTVEMNNLTIINFAIRLTGPINEGHLTTRMLLFQVACSLLALFIRYVLVHLVY